MNRALGARLQLVIRIGAQGGAESQAQADAQMAKLGHEMGAQSKQQKLGSCPKSAVVSGSDREEELSLQGRIK